jgi:peptidoglycan/xylan/chitin deacetylase (PgdA/CDA1 family)
MGSTVLRRVGRRSVVAVVTTMSVVALGSTPSLAAPKRAAAKVVSLSFDDGRVSQGVVDSLLASRHLRGTFFIITRAVNDAGSNPESLTWAQIHQLARDGNEIGGHTRTHPDLPQVNPTARRDEICGSRQDLLAQGFTPVPSFAYPYGDFDAVTERIVRDCGFASGRGAWGGPETIPPADRYGLQTLENVIQTDTVAGLEQRVTSAAPGAWLQYVFHDVGDAYPGGDEYRITTPSFTAFLDWLVQQRSRGAIVLKTIGDILH